MKLTVKKITKPSNNYSLDVFYTKVHKNILLAQSYTEIPNLSFIITASRLKPYEFVIGKKTKLALTYRHWYDEFGNSFKITNSKKIQIIYNDLALDTNKITCTDIYYGVVLHKIVKISQLVHLYYDPENELYLLTFLGIDNYFRSYLYLYEQWQQVSPLLLGISNLVKFAKNKNIRNSAELPNPKNIGIPCQHARQWLLLLPLSTDAVFNDLISKQFRILSPIFKKE